MTKARRYATLPLLLALVACSLDERELRQPRRSSSEQNEERETGENTSAESDDAPSQPAPGAIEWVDGCADLDTDGVADCMGTLVTTPSFATDVEAWVAIEGTDLAWDTKNAVSDEASGSAKLSGQVTTLRAMQCVPIAGKNVIIAYANAFVDADDEDPDDEDAGGTRALIEVSYFSHDDCSGDAEGLFETPPSSVLNEWTTVQAGGISNSTTQSVSITLIGVKADAATNDVVYFDNVMLKVEEP